MFYGDYKYDYYFEGILVYNFGENFFLILSWFIMFVGGDDNKDGDCVYFIYINVFYNIVCLVEIMFIFFVGFIFWKGMYDVDGVVFIDIVLKVFKNINIIDYFFLFLFVQVIVLFLFDKIYLIVGLSIGF